MIKKLFFAPVVILGLFFTGCIEDKVTRRVSGLETIPVEYKTSRKDVEEKLLELFPSEEVLILSQSHKSEAGPTRNNLRVEFTNPKDFPNADSLLDVRLEALREEALTSIDNIEEYRELVILFQEKVEENGFLKSTSIQKNINLAKEE